MVKTNDRLTGERMVPKYHKGWSMYYEHVARYIFACQFVKNKTVADIACGSGYGSRILHDFGNAKSVIGIDKSIKTIHYAQATYGISTISFRVGDIEKQIPILNYFPDVVVAFEVIEHLHDQEQFVRHIKSILAKRGIALFSTPNSLNYPYITPYHTKELSLKEFQDLLQKYFQYVDILHQTTEFCQTIRHVDQQSMPSLNDRNMIKTMPSMYSPQLNKKWTQSFVAVCSQYALPSIQTTAFNYTKSDGLSLKKGWGSFRQQFTAMQKEINILKNQLDEVRLSKYYVLWPLYVIIRDVYRILKNRIKAVIPG
jgi:2-polyprenyl-3-methyl-5-hydroxy-6-metoxy-1,4-benzoquinol methylase